jgi:protein ImuA
MRASVSQRVFMAGEAFADLRREIARIEQTAANLSPAKTGGGALLPFAIPKLDAMLGGGLRRAALHELRATESRDAAALTGFAAAILARLAARDARPLIWIVEKSAGSETGFPYGNGLHAFGLDPKRLVVVRVSRPRDALWACEEALRCSGLAAVVAELSGNPRILDLTASRRLALRAAESGVTGLLLRASAKDEPGAAATRWLVAPRSSGANAGDPEGIGRPAWRLTLERNRNGATGTFDVEWNHDERSFALDGAPPAHSRPLPSLPPDRPPAPPDERPRMARAEVHDVGPLLPREEKRRRLRARG